MGYSEGLQSGMNMGLGLLNFMDNRRKTALQEKRQAALDKRNELIFNQQQEDRNYDRTVLRPMREKTAKMGLSALESDLGWKRKNREHTEGEWAYQKQRRGVDDQYQDKQRALNDITARWDLSNSMEDRAYVRATRKREEQQRRTDKSIRYTRMAMQALQDGDKTSASSYFKQANSLNPAVGNMLQGKYAQSGAAFRDFTTGKRTASDPEVIQALRILGEPSMHTSGRSNKFDFMGVDSLPDGKFGIRMKPKYGGKYSNIIDAASQRFGVDGDMIRAMVWKESAGKKSARSRKGAAGLMQLMPETAKEVATELGIKNFNPDNPEHNIMAGTYYFAKKLKEFNGDPRLALAAYNAGAGAVRKYGNKIPPFKETQNYVPKILGTFKRIKQGVPATHGMSSEAGDSLVEFSAEDGIGIYQHSLQEEKAIQAALQQAGISYEELMKDQESTDLLQRRAGYAIQSMGGVTKEKEKWKRLNDDTLYGENSGEFKTVNGGIAGMLTSNIPKDDQAYPYAKLIDRQNPEMSLTQKSNRLKKILGDDFENPNIEALDKNMRLNREQSTKEWLLESLGEELASGDIETADIESLTKEIAGAILTL